MKKPNKYDIAAASLLNRVYQFIEDADWDHEQAAKLWRCISTEALDNAACFAIVAKYAYMKGKNTREDEMIDASIETVQEFLAARTPQPEETGEKE